MSLNDLQVYTKTYDYMTWVFPYHHGLSQITTFRPGATH